jgi:hypothetical protein
MWSSINQVVSTAVSAWLWMFQQLPLLVQFVALALPVTVLALLVYRYASDQKGIHAVKDKMKAYLLETRLFKDDLGVTLRAQGQILKHSAIYAAYALVPMAIMFVPVVLLLIQVESRYGFRPLQPGESTLVEVRVDAPDAVSSVDAKLVVPDGLKIETPAMRVDAQHSIFWRVRAQEPGDYTMVVRLGAQEFSKRVRVGESGVVSPAIYDANDIRTLAYPLEAALKPDSAVSSIQMTYPRSRGVFAGLSSASWILFGATLVLGFALRRAFGVTF